MDDELREMDAVRTIIANAIGGSFISAYADAVSITNALRESGYAIVPLN